MARYRSPSSAQAEHPDRTTPPRVVAVRGAHRLPAPPAASLCGRVTVAAVAAGAVVAAGQSLIPRGVVNESPPVTVSALLPVAEVERSAPAPAVEAIGGDQLLPDPLALGALETPDTPGPQVDVQSLTKAVDIGHELARRSSIIDTALADGAAEAHVSGESVFVRPVDGRFTSGFGARWGTSHTGIDIANDIGTPIYAITDGEVEDAGPAAGFGLWVVLRHDDGTQSVYGHVNRMFVEVGDEVRAGEEIAEVGNRGQSTGPHLHLEIWDEDGTKRDPVRWMRTHGIDY